MAAGDVVIKFSAEDAKLVQGFVRAENKLELLKRKQSEVGQASDSMGKKGRGALDGMAKSAVSFGKSFFGISAIIGTATKALSEFNAAREKAAESTKTVADSIRQLKELSVGASSAALQADFQRNIKQGGRLGRISGKGEKGGIDLLLRLISAGVKDQGDQELFAKLGGEIGQEDIRDFVSGTKKVQRASGGKLSTRQAINQLLVGAQESETTSQEFGSRVASSANLGRNVGGTTEESVALLSVLSQTAKNVEEAETQAKALINAISQKGFGEGKGVIAGIRDIQSQIEQGKDINALLTNTRAKTGFLGAAGSFGDIVNLQRSLTAATQAGPGEDRVSQLLSLRNKRADAELLNRRTTAETEERRSKSRGVGGLDVETARTRALFAIEQGDNNVVDEFLQKLNTRALTFFGASPETILESGATSITSEQAQRDVIQQFKRGDLIRQNTNGLDVQVNVANQPSPNASTE